MSPAAPTRSLAPFAILIGGQLVSFVGTTLTGVGIGIWVFGQTGSVMTFAWLTILTLVPAILISPFGGVIADTWRKKPAMLAVDSLSALSSATMLALLLSGRLEFWHLYANAVVSGLALGLQRPLFESTTPLMVDEQRLAGVNGIVHSVAGIGQVVAPVLAGTLVATLGLSTLLILDACTFLVAFGCTLGVKVPNAPRRDRADESFVAAFREGWRFVRERPGLYGMFWFTTMRNYLFATCEVVVVPLLLVVTTPEKTGAVLSVGGLGVLAGGLAMGLLARRRRLIVWVILAQGLTGLAMIVGGLSTDLVVIAVALALAFMAFPIEEASSTTIMQRKVPAALLGRVASVRNMMSMSAPPLAMLVAAPLADKVFEPLMRDGGPLASSVGLLTGTGPGRGMGLLLVVTGLATLVLTIVGWRSAALRNVETDLPDQHHESAKQTPAPARGLAEAIGRDR
ncbi:MFS transporter [Aureimonas pseudogalii]|uniref:MFS family permease n=1 Tax=Aureimonas pseudogalii TaxID=1744844 RepID=A0A7W6E8K3_9HYPH|nr:MFS transporter [Aureimonas pseudogalii]MBB3996742.1 MFS family permease [Aureimonas pseudogalii]